MSKFEIDINLVKKILLHRYPFLLIDGVIHVEYQKCAVGIKNVTANEPWVQGHFPDEPVFPGVMIIEAMAQVGGFVFFNKVEKNTDDPIKAYLCAVNNAKLIKKVIPGDSLKIIARYKAGFEKMAQVSCTVSAGGDTVATGVISYAFE